MLELEKLCYRWGIRPAVESFSARFAPGQVTALLGPNGCGKSTLLSLAAGQLRPETGTVRLQGADLTGLRPRELARQVALLRQSSLPSPLPVREVVLAGRWPHRRPGFTWSHRDRQAAEEAIVRTGCQDLAGRPENLLSGGERQRVLLAAALAQEAQVLLLDEPTTYLDIGVSLEMLALVRRLAAEEGAAVGVVLHDLPLAMRFADRVLVMEGGRLAAEGTPGALLENGVLEQVFGTKIRRISAAGEAYYRIG